MDKSLCWKVSSESSLKPFYLFGTVHSICKEDFFIPPSLYKIIEQVNSLFFEVNISSHEELQSMNRLLSSPDDEYSLSEEQRLIVEKVLENDSLMTIDMLDTYPLYYLYFMMSQNLLECSQKVSYEFKLMELNKDKGVLVKGLETVKKQLKYFKNAFSVEELVQQFTLFPEMKEKLGGIIKAYKEQDISRVYDLSIDFQYLSKKSYHFLLTARNRAWIDKIIDHSTNVDEEFLVAVGAAHLAGEYGLIELLKEKDFSVIAVK